MFRDIPHHRGSDWALQSVVRYPVLCTWIFALVFFLIWAKNDERRSQRRTGLLKATVAIALAGVITLVFRPWIAWPAPAQSAAFRDLFPRYLWGEGTGNSFPSHSTLAYFTLSMGLWPMARKLALGLALWTLTWVSFPRVYLGGHYPVDVLASIALGFLLLGAIWKWSVPPKVCSWLIAEGVAAKIRNFFFLVWVVELGEGFRATEIVMHMASRLASGG